MATVCKLVCGLALFLLGISFLGEGMERLAGGRAEKYLRRCTQSRTRGFLLGTAVTAVAQSSSAVTVIAVSLTDSGILTVPQVVPVIIGANVGTTATAWLLCLFQSDLTVLTMLPVALAGAAGVGLYLFSPRHKHWGMALLGFLLLLTGMETMTAAAEILAARPGGELLAGAAGHPLLGLLGGMLLTAFIQSSSASVGILQALSVTGQISLFTALPIVLGQNIGTCVTAFLATVKGGAAARQTALTHLFFNLIGAAGVMALLLFLGERAETYLSRPADFENIAVIHTVFNLLSAAVLLPFSDGLSTLAERLTGASAGKANR
ncbi:MAG: Na/Pi cotransporter family protein [Clostridiales bacterium]|nr:Na/Pi cotransporter family protein [Clostridiales bacterium]